MTAFTTVSYDEFQVYWLCFQKIVIIAIGLDVVRTMSICIIADVRWAGTQTTSA